MPDLVSALLGSNDDNLVITLYLQLKTNKFGATRVVILSDDDAKRMLEDPAKKAEVKILNTRWRLSRWREENDLMLRIQRPNPITNQMEPDWSAYRDLRIKMFMADWDLEANGQRVPVTPEAVDRLPPEVALELYTRYIQATGSGDEADQSK
jgi:hypothetical protein